MSTSAPPTGPSSARPDIVLIVADDLGWADLGCYGSTFHETPHLDALAASGVRFTQAYASAPVCSPSRASIMSGKYPARVGITQFIGGHTVGALTDVPYFHWLPQQEHAVPRALADDGYATWHVGKWHLGGGLTSPTAHGFEVNIGGGHPGSPSTYFSPYALPHLPDGPDGEYLTTRLTEEAVGLIENADPDRPFFLNLWHYTVHVPLQAPQDLIDKYSEKATRLGLPAGDDAIESGEPMTTWNHWGDPVRRRTVQSDPTYAAMLETLDDSVGAVVAALRAAGRLDTTMIIFTSDNGGLSTAEGSPTCNAPLSEGKGWLEDGGLRVPLIISGPQVGDPGVISAAHSISPDLYATVLAAAGVEPRPGQAPDAVSLLPALQGEFERGPIFWHYPHYSNQGGTPGAGVLDGRWKLIRWFEDDREALYDLVDDVSETTDRADDHPDIRARLGVALDAWLGDVGAVLPQPNPYHPPTQRTIAG